MKKLLNSTYQRAARFLEALSQRDILPGQDGLRGLSRLEEPLPEQPTPPEEVLALLDEAGSPAAVASAGPRYFGFVTGGALPAALAANWLAGAWDQNAGLEIMSPVASTLERVVVGWLRDLFGLPAGTEIGFVTGATMANFTCLAAARHALLARQGWQVEERGLFSAPEIKVVVGEEVHVSLLKALSMLGLGRERIVRVPADRQGRMRAEALPPLNDRTILCLQAGNVNTGAFDPAAGIIPEARRAGAWVHVDGAFGLWALADPQRAHLAAGCSEADSLATDAHKWLNVPYDSGLAICRHPQALVSGMSTSPAAYLDMAGGRDMDMFTPEMSRRARGVEVWAALRSLGRSGLAALIERCCQLAKRFADGLRAAGYEVHNEVVLNQVLVSFGDAENTLRVIRGLQQEGTFWAGSTVWQGHTAMRISVSNWATTEQDVDRSLEAIFRLTGKDFSPGC